MISTAAAHSGLSTPPSPRWLRVGLTVLEALEESRFGPLTARFFATSSERGENRLPLGVRRLGLDRRGHAAETTATYFVTQITSKSPL